MRIGVLTSRVGWHRRDLERAAGELGLELVPLEYDALAASVDEEDGFLSDGCDLRELDRLFVRAMPAGSLEQIVFRMDVLNRLSETGFPVVNPPRAIECAVDKYLALSRLGAAGLPVPATRVCERADQALREFESLGGDVVVKPLFGSLGRGQMRITHPELAWRSFETLERLGAVIYQQEFLPHPGWDYRLLTIGDRVVAAMKRRAPARAGTVDDEIDRGEWRTNIARGGRGEAVEPTREACELALRAAGVLGARIAGVDLLPDGNGALRILELNAAPGWRSISRAAGTDVAREILAHVRDLDAAAGV